ncbi:MAG: transketolase [Deltaproteobacteria bacterium]|nr:transketolase [Deltaproteobacteria bacterium]
MTNRALHDLAANTLRALAIDGVNKADSGHPGAPLGMADLAVVLFTELLRFDPSDPAWPNRDRFVLSNGHASMLLYGLLHLSGYDLPMEELKRFRQLGSKTPGHPEHGLTPGVETTTGPLGQGFANAVGMALAARMGRARFGGRSFEPIDHHVYAFCGDGCLMEGVSSEAASLAGHLGLGELVVVYDDNQITIDGRTEITFSEDVERRFQAYGWHTLRIDGHDPVQIREALHDGRAERERPTLILAKTHIGFGSNRQDTSKVHGEPLGEEEGRKTKEKLGWALAPFEVPAEVRALFARAADRGKAERKLWYERLAALHAEHPAFVESLDRHLNPMLGAGAKDRVLAAMSPKDAATRALSNQAIDAVAKELPSLIGGAADLAVSCKSTIKEGGLVKRGDFAARNIPFGVREHAMGSITTGLALSGMFIPFGATFLTFSDYMKPALRLQALMKLRAITVFTHDSVGLGEDGPTHQPIEHLAALRLIPGYDVWRPADGVETAMAWLHATTLGPARARALVFSRQAVPPLSRPSDFDPDLVMRGGYVVEDAKGAEVVLIGTGTEAHLAQAAAKVLGRPTRVVSMPSVSTFLEQDAAYQASVLPGGLLRVSIELGRTELWRAIVGREGLAIGVDLFGESAPWEVLREHYGMTPSAVAAKVSAWLDARKR